MSGDAELRGRLLLVKYGVPFDVAFSLDDVTLLAFAVIFGEFEGGQFDWNSLAWVRRD